MTGNGHPFARAEQNARTWLDAIMQCLDTGDYHYAHRVLRAWLHLVRDRLTVDSAAHLGAQLPELLRGMYYEGWRPSDLPIRYDATEFTQHYATEAMISLSDVEHAVTCVSTALRNRFAPGTLEHALGQLPPALRELLLPAEPAPPRPAADHTITDRLECLERSVASLSDTLDRIDQRLAATTSEQTGKYETVY
ncbi:DUF2267 domain-containing protein [Nocardia arthritidis]|uniref:DUF2267 domain-containing protein n=1 Tax=Nocardia arthritidis TaxID=228602 RepID=A0A6G9YBG9_9NOCA|nr:DUF2267 domain-containing protein [Nocardia arthritidis]QIS10571.1 DUF2267 domain-containing protein [Nocardia arthritidis]